MPTQLGIAGHRNIEMIISKIQNPKSKIVLTLVFMLSGWLFVAQQSKAAPLGHPAPSVLHDYILNMTDRTLTVQSYLRISPELVPEVYRKIDTDGDGNVSEAERQNWIKDHLSKLQVALDNAPLQLQMSQVPSISRDALLSSIDHPIVVNYTSTLPAPASGKHRIRLTYGDNYLTYDEYYLSVAGDVANDNKPVSLAQAKYPATYQVVYILPTAEQARNVPSGQLAIAPYTAPTPISSTGQGSTASATAPSNQSSNLIVGLKDQVHSMITGWRGELWSGLGMLLLAMLLGGLHALTPGHGKAMVAAYLVGSRGKVKDAALLGGVVTATHTIGVFALGLVLLIASNFALPRALQPALELVSGVLVLALGGYLLLTRLRELRAGKRQRYLHADNSPSHTHLVSTEAKSRILVMAGPAQGGASAPAEGQLVEAHAHHVPYNTNGHKHSSGLLDSLDYDHEHSHDGHSHAHPHSHVGRPLGNRTLIGLGISGGLVPCPDAIAILLFAGIGQIGLGLGLVAAFSLGLAAVLIGIGIALVKMKGALDSRLPSGASGASWSRWVPVASAVVVLLMGVSIVISALGASWS